MTHTPDYIIKLENEDIPLLFTNWTYRKYCERKGMDLDDLQAKMTAAFEDAKNKIFPLTEVPDVLLLAHESYCRSNRLPFEKDDVDADDWITETGNATSALYSKIYTLFVVRFFNKTEADMQVQVKETKKNEGKVKALKPDLQEATA